MGLVIGNDELARRYMSPILQQATLGLLDGPTSESGPAGVCITCSSVSESLVGNAEVRVQHYQLKYMLM